MNPTTVDYASPPPTVFDPSAPVSEEYDVFCDACGYSLLGLVADRCPECGAPFTPGDLPYARVPWLHRRRIGKWSAYWQTVGHVVRRPGAFAAELCRPVRISADDARRFRSLSIYVAATSALIVGLAIAWISGELPIALRQGGERLGEMVAVLLGLWLASVLFLRLATDMPVFIWKGLPSLPPTELAPLHHYAAAPLALAPVVGVVGVVLPALAWAMSASLEWGYLSGAVGFIVAASWVALCWRTPPALMKAATGCGPGRVAMLALYLPLHCLIMAALTWGVVMVTALVIVEAL